MTLRALFLQFLIVSCVLVLAFALWRLPLLQAGGHFVALSSEDEAPKTFWAGLYSSVLVQTTISEGYRPRSGHALALTAIQSMSTLFTLAVLVIFAFHERPKVASK